MSENATTGMSAETLERIENGFAMICDVFADRWPADAAEKAISKDVLGPLRSEIARLRSSAPASEPPTIENYDEGNTENSEAVWIDCLFFRGAAIFSKHPDGSVSVVLRPKDGSKPPGIASETPTAETFRAAREVLTKFNTMEFGEPTKAMIAAALTEIKAALSPETGVPLSDMKAAWEFINQFAGVQNPPRGWPMTLWTRYNHCGHWNPPSVPPARALGPTQVAVEADDVGVAIQSLKYAADKFQREKMPEEPERSVAARLSSALSAGAVTR